MTFCQSENFLNFPYFYHRNIGVEKIERMIDFTSGKIWYSSTVTEGVIKSGLGNSVIFREITTL